MFKGFVCGMFLKVLFLMYMFSEFASFLEVVVRVKTINFVVMLLLLF